MLRLYTNSRKLKENQQTTPASHSESNKKTRCSLTGYQPWRPFRDNQGPNPKPERLQIGLIRAQVPSGLALDTFPWFISPPLSAWDLLMCSVRESAGQRDCGLVWVSVNRMSCVWVLVNWLLPSCWARSPCWFSSGRHVLLRNPPTRFLRVRPTRD